MAETIKPDKVPGSLGWRQMRGETTPVYPRRNFLKTFAKTATAIAGASVLGSVIYDKFKKQPEQQPQTPPKPPLKTNEQKPSEIYYSHQDLKDFLLYHAFYSAEDKTYAEKEIDKWIKYYRQTENLKMLKNIVTDYSQMIDVAFDTLKKVRPDTQTRSKYLVRGIIAVESSGNPKAESPVAKGLCQLREMAVKDAIKHLDWAIPPPIDLFDPQQNITLAIAYLDRLHRIYKERGLSIWAYHLGQQNLNNAIRFYRINVLKHNPNQVDKEFSQTVATATAAEDYGINSVKLLTNRSIVELLKEKGAFEDSTKDYFFKVAAASIVSAQLNPLPNTT